MWNTKEQKEREMSLAVITTRGSWDRERDLTDLWSFHYIFALSVVSFSFSDSTSVSILLYKMTSAFSSTRRTWPGGTFILGRHELLRQVHKTKKQVLLLHFPTRERDSLSVFRVFASRRPWWPKVTKCPQKNNNNIRPVVCPPKRNKQMEKTKHTETLVVFDPPVEMIALRAIVKQWHDDTNLDAGQ